MPTIAENLAHWSAYGWPEGGEEWSVGAGGTPYVWHGTIMPRICALVPCGHILEIATGRGRFTERLIPLCERLTGVDIVESCTLACRARFAGEKRARFYTNDGRTLPMVEDESVDLAFSWDSLVHCDEDVIGSYLEQLAVKLRPGGVGLIHHSNLGEHVNPATGTVDFEPTGWRSVTMTAPIFRALASKAGLWCVCQELRTHGGPRMIDCISVVCRATRHDVPEAVVFPNREFYKETHNLRRIAEMYKRPEA